MKKTFNELNDFEKKLISEYNLWCKCKEMPIAYIKAMEYAKKIQQLDLSHLIV